MERLLDLIRRAAMAPAPRRPTRPTAAAKRRRRDAKARRAATKALRGAPRE
jgi:ribosome-associated protein